MQLQVETAIYKDGAIGNDINEAKKTATSYITNIDDNGISVHPAGNTNDRIQINSNGTEIYQGGNSVAQYGTTARIGKKNGSRFLINSDSLQAYAGTNIQPYFEVSNNNLRYGNNFAISTNNVIDSINKSQESSDGTTLKISADKVNIDGTAIFASVTNEVVKDIIIEYGVGQSSDSHADIDEAEGWSSETPEWVEDSYVWQRTTKQQYVYNTDTEIYELQPIITYACIQGAAGEGGVTIDAIEYAVSSTETQPQDSEFSGNTSVPLVGDGQWLWTRTTYSDGNKLYTKSKQGTIGRSVGSVEEHYARNDSSITPPSETTIWGTTVLIPTADEKYVWNYEVVKDSNGSTISTTSKHVVAMFGAEGKGISSITNYYARSTTTTAPSGDYESNPNVWKTEPWMLDKTNKYMWNYEVTTYTIGEPSITAKRIIAIYGDSGDSAYTVILTNENHTFVGDEETAISGQTADCNIIGYVGSVQKATSIGTITGNPTGMTVSISGNNTTSNAFRITVNDTMNSTHGVLTVPVTLEGKTFEMNFTYSLALAGTNGEPGVTYSLVCNPSSLVRTQSGLTPGSITFSATRTQGLDNPTVYSGRIKIEEYNGSNWTVKSSTDTSNISYSPTNTAKLVRATLYITGDTATQLDIQTVPIVEDGGTPTVVANYDSETGITTLIITDANGNSDTTYIKDGGEGAEWFYGPDEPANNIVGAKRGSMYLNTTTSNVYKCTDVNNNNELVWTLIMCLAAQDLITRVEAIYTRTDNTKNASNIELPNTIITNTQDTGMVYPSSNGNGWTLMHESRIAPPPSTTETETQITTRLGWKYLWTCNQLLGTDGYVLSTDTSVISSKTYYTRSGTQNNYTYTAISTPSGNPSIQDYYEIVYKLIGHSKIVADEGTTVIDGADITTGTITAEQIAAHTITANEIVANTITANEIVAHTITANEIATHTITANEIVANTITANEIATHTITANEITADNIISSNRNSYINLANGTFVYKDTDSWSTANSGIQWDGSNLNVKGAITATSLTIGSKDYINDIKTISNKASNDAEYEVVIKIISIDYTTSEAILLAIPTKLGELTTGSFVWYKNTINTAHGGTVSTTTNNNDTLTISDLDALYIAVLQ